MACQDTRRLRRRTGGAGRPGDYDRATALAREAMAQAETLRIMPTVIAGIEPQLAETPTTNPPSRSKT